MQAAIDEVSGTANEAHNIAWGATRSFVFDTFAKMEAWLCDAENKDTGRVGNNLYIVAIDVADYWITGQLSDPDPVTGYYYTISPLGAETVDLSNVVSVENKSTPFTASEQEQARQNIGAAAVSVLGVLSAASGTYTAGIASGLSVYSRVGSISLSAGTYIIFGSVTIPYPLGNGTSLISCFFGQDILSCKNTMLSGDWPNANAIRFLSSTSDITVNLYCSQNAGILLGNDTYPANWSINAIRLK